jgi:hypothetical protein
MEGQFDLAKWWWGVTISSGLLVVAIGVLSSITHTWASWLSILVALLSIGAVLAQWRSDVLRDSAEALLRKIEMRDGLGWPITHREIADLLLTVPDSVKSKASSQGGTAYFSTDSPYTPRRMLENLEESTWITKHQAKRMTAYTGGFSAIIVAIAVVVLLVALQAPANQAVATVVGAVVTAMLVFIFSAGLIQATFSYNAYAREAERIHEYASRLLQQEQVPSEAEVVKLLGGYQIVRVKAPLLPSWLWRQMEKELNTLWKQQKDV